MSLLFAKPTVWRLRYLLMSTLVHLIAVVLLFVLIPKPVVVLPPCSLIEVEVMDSSSKIDSTKLLFSNEIHSVRPEKTRRLNLGMLAPPRVKGLLGKMENPDGDRDNDRSEESRKFAHELLTTESKVWEVFDFLASKINRHLNYPEMLVDNGVQGNAALDLYFDSQGNVDEGRSKTAGDNRLVRGLLIRATRKGIVDWYTSDASRLRKEQFRNQHFRAEFILAYSQIDAAELVKASVGSYNFLRRHVSNISCIGEVNGAPLFNIACVLAGIGGAIHRDLSDKYKVRFMAIKDTLEYYDDLGLEGINVVVQKAT